MKLSIIIVNYKVEKEILACINSIFAKKHKTTFEIIIVDNSQSRKLQQKLISFEKKVIYIKSPQNLGFGAGINLGAKKASGDFLFILNPDTILINETIDTLVDYLEKNKKVGIVAPILLDKKKVVYEFQGVKTLTPFRAIFSLSFLNKFPFNFISNNYWMKNWDKTKEKDVEVAPGSAFVIPKKLFKSIGGFDENFFLYFEEFDLNKRVVEKKLKIVILPTARVVHLWGKSTEKEKGSNDYFAKSRFYYFKKNYSLLSAFLVEFFLGINKYTILLFFIFCFGLFLRFYKLPETMLLLGDQGWFYLSSYNLLVNHQIPLVGIPSSVVWLHQGPLTTYIMALALFVGKFNPVSPAFLFAAIDAITIFLVYCLGKIIVNRKIGLISALFFATSPVVLITARMPYHTSLIPFVAAIYSIFAYKVSVGKEKFIPWMFLLNGILLQLELSNAIILLLSFIFIFKGKIQLTKRVKVLSSLGFVIGILPFILYDLTHRFTQTVGFPLWILNRIRLFIFPNSHILKSSAASSAIGTTIGQILGFLTTDFRWILLLMAFFFLVSLIQILMSKNTKLLFFVCFSTLIPLLAFLVHSTPGVAYFPVLFPILSIIVGISIGIGRKSYVLIPLLLILIFFNVSRMVNNEYFIETHNAMRVLPVNNYSYGYSWLMVNDVSNFILKNTKNPIELVGKGYYASFSSNFDGLKYLLLINGRNIGQGGDTVFIYPNKQIGKGEKIIFSNNIFTLTKK